MTGYIHSFQSLGTVDGPGVRAVVFAAGCPLRCAYCHNPDTWQLRDGAPTSTEELLSKILRLRPYIKEGGVTFSGGEPCMQAEFFLELARALHREGLHVALDTSGAVTTEAAMELIRECDLVLLDIKFTDEERYKKYTGGKLADALSVLRERERIGGAVWIRQVILPGINDTEEDVRALDELLRPYTVIERTELLPFRRLCLEKYEALGIPFPLRDTPEADRARTAELSAMLDAILKE